MKKQYKLILSIIAVEFLIVWTSNGLIRSWFGSTIGSCLFFLPIEILLFMLGRDESFSKRKRTCFKVFFWYMTVCYLLSLVAIVISLIMKGYNLLF